MALPAEKVLDFNCQLARLIAGLGDVTCEVEGNELLGLFALISKALHVQDVEEPTQLVVCVTRRRVDASGLTSLLPVKLEV